METNEILEALGWTLPDGLKLLRVASRLTSAAALAAIVGWEREKHGLAAGLRTHMMVALGSALFAIVPIEEGADASDIAQMVKGIAAGIGFLGAGAILKLPPQREIKGLTTASSIWLTAAVGLSVGCGQFWTAVIATFLSLVILFALKRAEPDESQKSPVSADE